MNNMKHKILSLLVLLLTAATGAWAEDFLYLVVDGTSATMMYGADKGDNPYYTIVDGDRNWYVPSAYDPETYNNKMTLTTVTIDASCKNYTGTTLESLFDYWSKLTTINNLENLNTSAVTDMYRMFAACQALTSLDLSRLNTASVTNMHEMFIGLTLETIDLSGWNTSNVTDMYCMFYYSQNLKTIYVGDGWSTASVTNGKLMFSGCTSLPGFDSGKVTYEMAKLVPDGYLTYKAPAPTEPAIEVTTNAASEGATFTEASFQMPAFDATAEYELVRDMAVDVNATIADRIRIKKENNAYVAVIPAQLVPVITDELDEQNPVTMVLYNETNKTGDYTVKLQKKVEGDTPSWADATALSVGTFRYVITGAGLYDGEITTPEFQLFEGYPLEIAKGEYATFYGAEAVVADAETSSDAVLYTISSVSGDKAVLSDPINVAPKETPLLVYNSSEETKTFLLIPTTDPNLALTVAPEFTGTLTGTTIAASDANTTNYAFNGKQFVYVKNAIDVAANKAWLAISATNAPVINLVFGDATKIENTNVPNLTNGDWYDLNGRKLQKMPTKKGVYIMNGKKVVVK